MSLVSELYVAGDGISTPMSDSAALSRRTQVPDFDFVLFGATGDLAARKLLPSLLQREADGVLPPHGRILCIGREPFGQDEFVARALAQAEEPDREILGNFRSRITYIPMDVTDPASYDALAKLLAERDAVRVFYLAVAP